MTAPVARLLGMPADAGATVEILTAVEGAVMAWVTGSGGTCPRCGTPLAMRHPVEANALSRCTRNEDDTPLYVCSPCGTSEAFQQWVGILDQPSTWAHPPTTTVEDVPATQ